MIDQDQIPQIVPYDKILPTDFLYLNGDQIAECHSNIGRSAKQVHFDTWEVRVVPFEIANLIYESQYLRILALEQKIKELESA